MSKIKLKDLLSESFIDTPRVNKHEVVEGVRNYGIVGKQLYNSVNVMEVAKQLSRVAESAHSHILGENEDWFDQVSVNRNMKALKTNVAEFKKTAMESHQLNQRLQGLYEDIGHVLNRYYDISEDKGDMDKDGVNEPDDEEYLDNKRDAITKAVKGEAVGDPDDRDPVDRPDSPADGGFETKNESGVGYRTSGKDDPDAPAGSGKEMKENEHPLKKKFKDIGGVVSIGAIGGLHKKW